VSSAEPLLSTAAPHTLAARQNSDGGWPYTRGVSWTEPTVYAVLALLDAGEKEPATRGLNWLRTGQRQDGAWAPQAGVDESSWVTAVVALLPPDQLGGSAHARAIDWIAGVSGEESSLVYRVREWLLGRAPLSEREAPGWPWVPGTAAWVAPTSMAILALAKQCRRQSNPELQTRLDQGRRFLLDRMCKGGGWNHGSTEPLGYPSSAYPETTGLALLALRGMRASQIDLSVPLAQRFLRESRSADATNWLRLGLQAQQALPPGAMDPNRQLRTVPEMALDWIAQAAREGRDRILG
jgi:hypothetical protein